MAQILLAEDDDSMREFLAKALTRAGHEVRAVGDGLDALTTLAEEQQKRIGSGRGLHDSP